MSTQDLLEYDDTGVQIAGVMGEGVLEHPRNFLVQKRG